MVATASRRSSILRTERRAQRAFTLVEVLISAALATFILAAVLSTFLMIGRTGANIQNYTELEDEARKTLEVFSREARLAVSVASGYSSTSVTLSIPDTSNSRTAIAYTVTYTFDTTNKKFTRTGPPVDQPGGTVTTTTLINNVQQISGVNPFNYYRYVTSGGYQNGFTSNTASSVTEIKQIELNFVALRSTVTVASATNKVLSARFILRNK